MFDSLEVWDAVCRWDVEARVGVGVDDEGGVLGGDGDAWSECADVEFEPVVARDVEHQGEFDGEATEAVDFPVAAG